jgi:cation diffusion facilitator CzcD-associated flavoprotein CzcO
LKVTRSPDIRGVDGLSLKDKWKDGPQTFLGILVDGFPNLLMVMGPHAGLGNFPRAVEYTADWVTGLIGFARDRGLTLIEATATGAVAWTDHVIAASEGLLFTEVDSWMTGIAGNGRFRRWREALLSGRPLLRNAPNQTKRCAVIDPARRSRWSARLSKRSARCNISFRAPVS